MAKGGNDKKSNSDSRGSEGQGIGMDAVSKANKIEFVEPKDGGGAQGSGAKNHWDGTGSGEGNENKSKASREPQDGRGGM